MLTEKQIMIEGTFRPHRLGFNRLRMLAAELLTGLESKEALQLRTQRYRLSQIHLSTAVLSERS
jgi:hypothetical protein